MMVHERGLLRLHLRKLAGEVITMGFEHAVSGVT